MGSLDTMLAQLQQVSQPTAAPTAAPNTAALMAEMQDLNGKIGPLMARMQTALQGNATPAEIAAIRAELDTVNGAHESADGGNGPCSQRWRTGRRHCCDARHAAAMSATTGTSSDLQQVEQLLLQAQTMLQQIKGQGSAAGASMAGMPATTAGAMPMATPDPSMSGMGMMGMMGMMDMMPMGGSSSMSSSGGSMPSMPASAPMAGMPMDDMAMDDMAMMSMMDNMMTMLDTMTMMMDMGMGGSGAMSPSSMSGSGSMAMPTDTPMPMMDDMDMPMGGSSMSGSGSMAMPTPTPMPMMDMDM